MGLDGSTCSDSLPERTCHFEPPEHVPRTSARAQTCVRGPGGLPACHGAESTRKDPRPEEKKMSKGRQNTFIYMYISTVICNLRSATINSCSRNWPGYSLEQVFVGFITAAICIGFQDSFRFVLAFSIYIQDHFSSARYIDIYLTGRLFSLRVTVIIDVRQSQLFLLGRSSYC